MVVSMEFSFYKIRLIDSDYLLINTLSRSMLEEELLQPLTAELCDRIYGVGASGVILLGAGDEHTARLHYFDTSGERRNCPPDAVLCAARYSFDFGLAERERLLFELEKGIGEVRCIDSSHFRLALPAPRDPYGDLLQPEGRSAYTLTLSSGNSQVTCTPLQFDIPVAAIYSEDESLLQEEESPDKLPDEPVEVADRPYMRAYYTVLDKEELLMTLPGRRPGHLASCAAACGTAALFNGFSKDQLALQYLEEELFYQWRSSEDNVLITASPNYVFTGEYYFEEGQMYPAEEE
jgi:diaminopimelate epimerase